MKKIVSLAVVALIAGWFVWKWLQSPETLIKKKTQKLIALGSRKSPSSEIGLISKVSKMDKFIHFDVRVKAEYEGQIWTAKSLNEFRSLLFTYFKQGTTGHLSYKNLTVELKEGNKEAVVKLDTFFEKGKESISCKTLLEWLKEKRWFIKKIELTSCTTKSPTPIQSENLVSYRKRKN